jgi:heat-inducible transcriptional repressor
MKARLEEVLNSLIKCYLKTKKPVSSSQLKELMNIELSASSIRGYFQELQKKGLIEKPHSSSGSIPSKKAMKLFWSENLKPFKIDLKSLEKKAIDNDIAVIVKVFENKLLKKVYNF